MAAKNTAQVVIGGKIVTLCGYESQEYFQKVASYMNNKIGELSSIPGYSRQAAETKHTLLSLNISDDYFKAKKQAEVLEQDLQQKDIDLYELKHELVSLQMQIESARKEAEDARRDNLMLNQELEKTGMDLERTRRELERATRDLKKAQKDLDDILNV